MRLDTVPSGRTTPARRRKGKCGAALHIPRRSRTGGGAVVTVDWTGAGPGGAGHRIWLRNSWVRGSLASVKNVAGGPCSTMIPLSVK